MKKSYLMALVALTMFSCAKENEAVEQDGNQVPGLELTITGAKTVTRADGDKLAGVGDENRIYNFGAFVKEVVKGTGGAATAANGKVFVFREIADYAGATSKKLSFGEVAVGSDVYVIANYKQTPALSATTGEGETTTLGTTYTQVEIEALLQKIEKADLNSFSVALQADPANPVFVTPASSTNSMLMTGTAKVPTAPMDAAPDDKKVKLEVPIERQFVKMNAGMPTVGDTFKDENDDVVIDKNNLHPQAEETVYFLRRTTQTLYYFDYAKSLMKLPFIKDVVGNDIAANGSNTTLNNADATEYRYVYERGSDEKKANFYATRNEAIKDLGATSIIYKIGYKCDIDIPAKTVSETQTEVITTGTVFYRYYKAYVAKAYGADGRPTDWSTGVGLSYQFDNTLVGWGSDTEDEAIDDKESVDINVLVKMKEWTVKTASIPME